MRAQDRAAYHPPPKKKMPRASSNYRRPPLNTQTSRSTRRKQPFFFQPHRTPSNSSIFSCAADRKERSVTYPALRTLQQRPLSDLAQTAPACRRPTAHPLRPLLCRYSCHFAVSFQGSNLNRTNVSYASVPDGSPSPRSTRNRPRPCCSFRNP